MYLAGAVLGLDGLEGANSRIGVLAGLQFELALVDQHGGVTSAQPPAVDVQFTAHQVHIALAQGDQWQHRRLLAVEQTRIQLGIGVDGHRTLRTVRRGHQAQRAALLRRGKGLLLVAGRDAGHVRLDPDLEEMGRVLRGMVELAVQHAIAGAHALHVAGRNGTAVAHVVLVRQLTRQHVADDLHVAVAVGAEAGAGSDAVFVDDAQIAQAHELRVVVTGKGETVEGLEPAVVGVAAVLRFAKGQHDVLLVGA